MGLLMLVLVIGMLITWNQPGAAQVLTCRSSSATSVQSSNVTPKAYRVTGYVLDDVTGKPLSGAKVTLTTIVPIVHFLRPPTGIKSVPQESAPPKPVLPKPNPMRVTVTGNDGQFAFDGVPHEMFELMASKAGYLDVRHPQIGMGPHPVNLTSDRTFVLRLSPAASISGIARDHAGLPLRKNENIALYSITYWEGWPMTQYVGWPKRGTDGTYHFDDLQPGRYYLVVSPPWNRAEPERLEGGRAIGEVPERYPAPTIQNPSPYFTLYEGEQKKVDLALREETLHHVVMTMRPAPVLQVLSASGGIYLLHEDNRERGKYEAWLPDGSYWPTNQRPGEIDGSLPFKVMGADVSGLRFASAETGTTTLPVTVKPSIDGSSDLKCAPFAAADCWVATLYLLYLDPARGTGVAASVQLTASMQPIAIRLLPGRYAAVLLAQRNLYAESIRSGSADLAQAKLVIHQGQPPAPIEVELAQAAEVDGVVKRKGQPVAAYVYALPLVNAGAADYRLFDPVQAKSDGTFQIQGLASGAWTIFATDAELSLNVHDPADTAYWREHGTIVHTKVGHTAHTVVKETSSPKMLPARVSSNENPVVSFIRASRGLISRLVDSH